MVQGHGRTGQHGETALINQEGDLIGDVRCPAIFHHPHPPGGKLVGNPMIQKDHAIRYIFFQPVPRKVSVTLLGGHNRGQPAVLQPPEQPANLRAQYSGVSKSRENRFDRIQHHALCSDFVHRVLQPDE